MSKVLVVMSTGEMDKAVLGVLWATVALGEKWVEDIELVFFGPVEEKIALGNNALLKAIDEFKKLGMNPYSM